MTAKDWDEIFWRLVVAAQRAFDDGVPSVHLEDLEEGSAVGFYDMRALCRERPADLLRAGLTFTADRLYQADQPEQTAEPPPTHVAVDGQVCVSYTFTTEQCKP